MTAELLQEIHGARPRIIMPGQGKETRVFGVRVTILVDSTYTGGAYCSYQATVEPGQGPPPHVHQNEDEAFFVQQGQFEISIGDETVVAGPGSYVFMPRHIPHTFKNIGKDTGLLLGTAAPGGHERFFADADALDRSGNFTPVTAVEVCRKHGIEVLVPVE